MKKTLIFIFFLFCGCEIFDESYVRPVDIPKDIKPHNLLWAKEIDENINQNLFSIKNVSFCCIYNNNIFLHYNTDDGTFFTNIYNSETGEKISKIQWDFPNKYGLNKSIAYYNTNNKDFFISIGNNGISILHYFDQIKQGAKLIKIIEAGKTIKILGEYKKSLIIHESNKVEVDYDGKLLYNNKYGNSLYFLNLETNSQEFITGFKEIEKENVAFNYYTDDVGSSIIVASYTKNNGLKEFIMAYDLNNNKLIYSDILTGKTNVKPILGVIKSSLISSFVINNKSLFISSDIENEIMRVLDVKTGKFKWSKQLPRHNVNSNTHQTEWSIYYTDKYLICFNEYFFSSINTENGDILWTRQLHKPENFSILNDIAYFYPYQTLIAFDLQTGIQYWDNTLYLNINYFHFFGTKKGENGNKGKIFVADNENLYCFEAIR